MQTLLAKLASSLSWPAHLFTQALSSIGLAQLGPFLYALLLASLFYIAARLVRHEEADRVLTASLAALWTLVVILVGIAMVVPSGG